MAVPVANNVEVESTGNEDLILFKFEGNDLPQPIELILEDGLAQKLFAQLSDILLP